MQDQLVSILSIPNKELYCIYVVDGETYNNVFTLMKRNLEDQYVEIPIKYRKHISKLINLTNSKKNLLFRKCVN